MRNLAIATFIAVLATAASAAETYTIDPNHTLPVFEVNHLGFTTQRGLYDTTRPFR